MKALLVATTFPRWPRDSGPAPFVFHLAKHLNKILPVNVLAPHFPGARTEETMDGVEVRRFRYLAPERLETLADGRGLQNHIRGSFRAKLEAAALVAAEFFALRRLLAAGEYTAVNAHWLVPSGALAAACKKSFGYRLVLTVHAADLFLLLRIPLGKGLLRWIVGRADAVFCVSESILGGLVAVTGPSEKFRILPMGADLEMFSPARDKPAARQRLGLPPGFLILFAGKLTEKKGVSFLLQAFAKVKDHPASPSLVVLGEGILSDALKSEARRLGIADRVLFPGAKPQDELSEYYRAADVVAAPSVRDASGEAEGMPVVILEALASGAPVIATEVCSAPESLKGRGVIEIPSADVEALAQALQRAMDGNLPPVDRAAVEKFNWPEIARHYAAALRGDAP